LLYPRTRGYVSWQASSGDCPATTAVEATLVASDVRPDGVHIEWYAASIIAATVERREVGAAWQSIATVVADDAHRLIYDDANVQTGTSYDYRLAVAESDGTRYTGQTSVTIPVRPRLAISAVTWDRAGRGARVALSVPSRAPATLELFDVLGRRWSEQTLSLAPGTHEIPFASARPLGPGVYFVRVTQESQSVRRRFVVVW